MAKKRKRKRARFNTPKQEAYFKYLCQGMSATKAALKAGYKSVQSAYQGTRGLRSRIADAFGEAGLTPEGIIHKHILPALKAEETEFCKFEGKIGETRQVVAWGPRLHAIEIVNNMAGYNAPKELTGEGGAPLFPDVIDTSGMRKRRPNAGAPKNI
jgi:hypothetical protein